MGVIVFLTPFHVHIQQRFPPACAHLMGVTLSYSPHCAGHVLQVAENGMCNYEMTLETPAACKPGPGVVGADQGDSNSWSNWFSGFGAKDEM